MKFKYSSMILLLLPYKDYWEYLHNGFKVNSKFFWCIVQSRGIKKALKVSLKAMRVLLKSSESLKWWQEMAKSAVNGVFFHT